MNESPKQIEMKPVTSSNIAAIGYQEEGQILRVLFTTGVTYEYEGVPAETAQEFMEAESVGKYFHANIKKFWAGKKLEPVQEKPKPNCYMCKHRGKVAGDTHSCCNYPGTKTDMFDLFIPGNKVMAEKLGIKANEHGVTNGWFMWPVNFDPVWLLSCNGYELKAGETNA